MTRYILNFLCLILLVYVILGLVLYFFQNKFLYLPYSDHQSTGLTLEKGRLIQLKTSDNLALNSWYYKAKNPKKIIVYFHGNAGDLKNRENIIEPYLDEDYSFLLLSYRGYSNNPGTPSEQGLYTDARAAMDFALSEGFEESCIILFGESLGSAVAIQMAIEYKKIGALILRAPITSLRDVASYHYRLYPAKWLVREQYDSYNKISKISAPKLFVQGNKDIIIPISMGEKLYDKAIQPKEFITLNNFGHNDLPDFSDLVMVFLQKHNLCN